MPRSQQDAWEAFRSLAGPNHPAVKPWMGRAPGLSGNVREGAGSSCVVAQQLREGYWPYPWLEMPPGGLPFDEFDSINTPAANGVENVVLSYQIPFGYDGVILAVANIFTGPGFVPGSGDLVWRIRVGGANLTGRPQLNYSNIQVGLGGTATPRDVQGGILVTSGQFVVYTVTHTVGSPIVPGGTRIVCNIQGFYWPRGSSPTYTGGAR